MPDYIIYNGELYHYGVKGMQWGKRKIYPRESASNYEKFTRTGVQATKSVPVSQAGPAGGGSVEDQPTTQSNQIGELVVKAQLKQRGEQAVSKLASQPVSKVKAIADRVKAKVKSFLSKLFGW